jgi:hypothetical protein
LDLLAVNTCMAVPDTAVGDAALGALPAAPAGRVRFRSLDGGNMAPLSPKMLIVLPAFKAEQKIRYAGYGSLLGWRIPFVNRTVARGFVPTGSYVFALCDRDRFPGRT